MQKFEDFGLSIEVLDALEKKGFEEPSDIQKLVIPELLKDRTGTDRDRKNCRFWNTDTGNS